MIFRSEMLANRERICFSFLPYYLEASQNKLVPLANWILEREAMNVLFFSCVGKNEVPDDILEMRENFVRPLVF